jgi:hypothetical protein
MVLVDWAYFLCVFAHIFWNDFKSTMLVLVGLSTSLSHLFKSFCHLDGKDLNMTNKEQLAHNLEVLPLR